MKRIAILVITMIFALIIFGAAITRAEPVQVLENTWALGIDESSGCPGDIYAGWSHSSTVSLSRCPKNPAPAGMTDGAAFKNGPVSGGGIAGVETVSVQSFTLPPAEAYTFDFSALIICVRCEYLQVDLFGDGQYLGSLLQFTDGSTACDTSEKWPRYCGDSLTVDYAAEYEIHIRSMWTRSNSLGVKWTGLELHADASGAQPTPTPSPVPTQTPEPTPAPIYVSLAPGQTGVIMGQGCILEIVSISEYEVTIECN